VLFKRLKGILEIAQRQDALKKLQTAHKVLSTEVMQRHTNGGTRTVFTTEIDWLNESEARLGSEEAALEEDRTTAELASRESKVVSFGLPSWFTV
jgi:hypothetical protein